MCRYCEVIEEVYCTQNRLELLFETNEKTNSYIGCNIKQSTGNQVVWFETEMHTLEEKELAVHHCPYCGEALSIEQKIIDFYAKFGIHLASPKEETESADNTAYAIGICKDFGQVEILPELVYNKENLIDSMSAFYEDYSDAEEFFNAYPIDMAKKETYLLYTGTIAKKQN